MSEAKATLRATLGAPKAQRAAAALRPDDDAFVSSRAEGERLVVEVRAKNLRSLLRALEDVLASVAVSEDLLRTPSFDDA